MRRVRGGKLYRGRPGRPRLTQRHYPRFCNTRLLSDTSAYFLSQYSVDASTFTAGEHEYDAIDDEGCYYHWPYVTSPLARRALVHLAKIADTDETYMDRLFAPEWEWINRWYIKIWYRLLESGLAQQIALGPEHFASSRDLLTRMFFLSKPAKRQLSLEDKLDELCINLDSMLLRRDDYSVFKFRPNLSFGAVFSFVVLLFYGFNLLTAYSTLNLWTTLLFLLILVMSQFFDAPSSTRTTTDAHATLLFHYLLHEFSDDGEIPERVVDLEESGDR